MPPTSFLQTIRAIIIIQSKIVHIKEDLKYFNLLCAFIFFNHLHISKKAIKILTTQVITLNSVESMDDTKMKIKSIGKIFKNI